MALEAPPGWWAGPVELQAGEVGVAAGVGGDPGVAGALPVLAGRPERVAAGEPGRHLAVGPGPAAVAAVGGDAAGVAPAVVVVADDQVAGCRVDGHRGLVVGLPAAGQVDVGQVEAVAVGLDVAALAVRAAQAVGGDIGVARAWRAERGLTAALVAAGFSSLVANPERIRRWIRLSFE
jgi:hypothetical protein